MGASLSQPENIKNIPSKDFNMMETNFIKKATQKV